MSPVHADVRWVVDVREEHRSWLSYGEIDLLHDFELQAWAGWALSAHQRRLIERMVTRAHERREMAISLSRRAPVPESGPEVSRRRPG